MDGGRGCEIVCSSWKLSRTCPNNLSRHCDRTRWRLVGSPCTRFPPGLAKDGLMALVPCGNHVSDKVGAGIDSRARCSSQGPLCCRDRSWDNRILLVVSAQMKIDIEACDRLAGQRFWLGKDSK